MKPQVTLKTTSVLTGRVLTSDAQPLEAEDTALAHVRDYGPDFLSDCERAGYTVDHGGCRAPLIIAVVVFPAS